MKKSLLLFVSTLITSIISTLSYSQTTVTHNIPFSSGAQSMWGPSGASFNLNMNGDLFNTVDWDLDETLGESVNVLGYGNFGAEVRAQFEGSIDGTYKVSGFNNGTVDVDYPINVTLSYPNDNTYDPGDIVVIETSYLLTPGWSLESNYPTTGEVRMDLDVDFDAKLGAEVCAFGCLAFNLFDINKQVDINLFKVNQAGCKAVSVDNGPYQFNYPGLPFVSTSIAGDPMGEYGFDLRADLPSVNTNDNAIGLNLQACGNDKYIDMELNIFDLLGHLPAPVGPIFANLDGDEDLDPYASIEWSFFSAFLEVERRNFQCFDFTPTVEATFNFPLAVEFSEYTSGGTLVQSGVSNNIKIKVGNELRYRYPCHYVALDITPTYSIKGRITNHTYDEMPLSMDLSAIEFDVNMPNIIIVPEVDIPEECWSETGPCVFDNTQTCTIEICTPAVYIAEIAVNVPDFQLGPVWTETVPLTTVTTDWFDQTWNLAGFSTYTRPKFTMRARPVSVTRTITDVACNGANTGGINVTISTVSPANPYTYAWTNGTTTQDLNNVGGGAYELVAVDNNGCSYFTGGTIVEPTELEASYSKVDVPCFGGPAIGSIDATVFGGTPLYNFSWSNGANTEDISGLAAGNYTLTATDSKGCNVVLPVTISQPNLLGQNGSVTPVNCFGGSDGAIDITTYGGSLPYSFNWLSSEITEDLDNLIANSYTLNITDANGCLSTAVYAVTEPPTAVSLTSFPTDVSCYGGNDGIIDIGVSGGIPGYTFQWISDLGGVLPYTSEDISNIPYGTYTVTATDTKGCQLSISQFVDQPIAPLATAPVLVDIPCFGDVTGSVDPVISGGTSPYTYLWSNGATTSTLPAVTAGTYTLTVTDAKACQDVYDYTLNEPLAPLSVSFVGTDILCFGDATGEITALVEGGTTLYSYIWSNGGTSETISNVIAGNYSLTITDDQGCTLTDNQTLNQPAAPLELTSIITDVDCYGNNSGSIDITITGGTGPYLQLWSNGSTIVLSDTTQDISSQYADSYTVLVTDANACTSSLISTVNEPTAPLAINSVLDHANCFGLNDGTIDINVTGGTTNYSYLWSSGQTTEDLSSILAGTYSVTVTDFNNCVEVAQFTILQPTAPLNVVTTPTHVLCNGGSTGMIDSEVTGGTVPYSYTWSSGQSTEGIIGMLAGPYTLTITDNQGCIAFTGTTITEPPALVVAPVITDASCYEYSDGQIVINISGGVAPYYFNWGNQNEILLNNPSETITGLIAEDYFIRVTDEHGCINEQIIAVGQPTPFVATSVVTDALCFESVDGMVDVTIVGGTLPYSSVWSDGQTTEDGVNMSAGDYSFEVTDAQGCILKEEVTVGQPTQINITYNIEEVSCIDQSDASINVNPWGGTLPYSYLWSTGSTELNAENLPPSTYTITITDDHLCQETFTFEIITNPNECMIIPNAFSPNGDNYNDTWVLGNIELYPNMTVKVFNKWGNEIYSSEGIYTPWDGTHHDNVLPSEVYYYIILLNNAENNQYTGTITIIR